MGNVYEACSKEPLDCRPQETKTQFLIVSHATVMGHGGFIVDGTNMKMEFLVKTRELQKQHHTD